MATISTCDTRPSANSSNEPSSICDKPHSAPSPAVRLSTFRHTSTE
jgi:hypothetical protein